MSMVNLSVLKYTDVEIEYLRTMTFITGRFVFDVVVALRS